ncbi:rod-binding protein [Aurantimonas aggregata]|uniref:Rod-binding protein n=1 Tax=Aurantimonas aggregata TaxID=2047720 RepID=A0A6L9MD16_9HYPH|nr:rod-binding protein [Aurantimonas aggregata]NDV85723.1 rod-binding protein [Aurantimonas aggregata]
MTIAPLTSTSPLTQTAAAPKPSATRASAAAGADFTTALDAAGGAASQAAAVSAPISPLVAHQSRVAPPLEQFEGFVLRSFVESMLPTEASSYFGSGTAGEVWRSMMAEEIGNELAKGGGIGIADAIAADRSSQALPGKSGDKALNDMLRDSDVARAGAARLDTTR